MPRYSAKNGQASRRTSLREHAGNAQPTGSAKDRKRTASPSAALRFSFFLSCTFPRGSGSTFRGGFCFSHSFLAFFWLSLAAHFLLCNLNQIRIRLAAAHSAEQPRRLSRGDSVANGAATTRPLRRASSGNPRVRRSEKLSRKGLIETAKLFHADNKLGQCIVRCEFSEYSITARLKRLELAA